MACRFITAGRPTRDESASRITHTKNLQVSDVLVKNVVGTSAKFNSVEVKNLTFAGEGW